MIVIDYSKNYHTQIIRSCVVALKKGKTVVYPTDTSYGLAVDATNIQAVKKLYQIKGRDFIKPVHVVVPSLAYAKKLVRWSNVTSKLVKKFWPDALTIVSRSKYHVSGIKALSMLSARTGFLGVRMPDNKIALDLSKALKKPITATSANRSGQPDCFSAADIIKQFKKAKFRPDIIINVGKLPRRLPSTIAKIDNNIFTILRSGPISRSRIKDVLKS